MPGLPFFQGKADFGDIYPSIRVYCTEPKKIAQKDDILMSVRAPVGSININKVKSCIGRGLAAIRHSRDIEHKYLYHFLNYYEPRLAEIGKGSTFEAVNREDIEDIEIPLPDPNEQKRVATILDKADRLRRQRRFAHALSASFLQSVFTKMFGDPVSNPRNWETLPLSKLCTNITDGTHDTPERVEKGVPFITSKNVRSYRIDLSDLEFVSEETHNEIIKRCNPQKGDVLYTNIGVNVGNAVANDLGFSFSLKNVALLQPNRSKLSSHFLESLLNYEPFKRWIIDISSQGGAQKFISLEILRITKAIAPPLTTQEKFAAIAQKFKHVRRQQREATRQAEHLFQTLLHRAFRGEL